MFNFIPLIDIQSIQTFERPYFFLALLLIPLYLVFARKIPSYFLIRLYLPGLDHSGGAHSDTKNLPFTFPMRVLFSSFRFWALSLSLVLAALSFVALTAAMARPMANLYGQTRAEGLNIYFVLDMSSSMKAYDYTLEEMQAHQQKTSSLPPRRYEVAVSTIRTFIDDRQAQCHSRFGEIPRCDRFGLVVFGQSAFLDIPLTIDYALFNRMLERRTLDDIDSSQTAIGDGLARAIASLRHLTSPSRVIILLTDGDKKGGQITVAQAIEAAKIHDIRIFPILIGKHDNALMATGSLANPTFTVSYFPTNFALLEDIARQTQGTAYRIATDAELHKRLSGILETLQRDLYTGERRNNTADLSLAFVAMAFFLAFVAYLIRSCISKLYP